MELVPLQDKPDVTTACIEPWHRRRLAKRPLPVAASQPRFSSIGPLKDTEVLSYLVFKMTAGASEYAKRAYAKSATHDLCLTHQRIEASPTPPFAPLDDSKLENIAHVRVTDGHVR